MKLICKQIVLSSFVASVINEKYFVSWNISGNLQKAIVTDYYISC